MKKTIAFLSVFALFTSQSFAFDLSQELTTKGWVLSINEQLTLDVPASSFTSNVDFSSKKIADIEGQTTQAFEDKWFGAFSLKFSTKQWGEVTPTKPLVLGVSWLDSYTKPALLQSYSGTVSVIEWEDNIGTFEFELSKNLNASYKIVDLVANGNSTSVATSTGDVVMTSEVVEETVILEDKKETGANATTVLFLILAGLLWALYVGNRKVLNS